MRTAGPITLDILTNADRDGIAEIDMSVWTVRTLSGSSETFAFWTEHDNESATVVSPFTGLPEQHDFYGGCIVSVGETPRTSDLSIRRKSIVFAAEHPRVIEMWRNHDTRLAQVAFYQAVLDTKTRNVVEALLEFVGEVNGAPKEVAAVGGESAIRFDCVSDSRQLTRVNHAKRSNEHQRSRNASDGFHKYIGVAQDWQIPFGRK